MTKKQENKMTNFTVMTRTDNTHHRNISQHKGGERVVSYNVLLHADNTPLPPSKTRDQIGPPSSTVSSAAGKVSQMGRMSNTHDFFRNGNGSLHRHVNKHHQRTFQGHKKYVSMQKIKPLVTKDLQDRSTVLSSEPKRMLSYKINNIHKGEESKENSKIIKEATKLLVYHNDSWLPKPNDNKAQRMVSHLMTFGRTSIKIAECLSNGTKPCVDQNDEKKTKLLNAFFKLHSDDIRSRLANRLVEIGKAAMTKGKELQSRKHYGEQDDLLHEITGQFKAQGPFLLQEINVDDQSYSNHTARHLTANNNKHMDVESPESKYKGVKTSKLVNASTISIAKGSRVNQVNDSQNRINTNTRAANDDSYKAHLMAAIQNASPTYHKTALCSHGHMHRNVIPRYALHSGEIVLHGIVASMDRCIKYCCESHTCNLALLVKMECFTITCKSEFHCQFIPHRGHRKTEAVHVYRGGLRFKLKKNSQSKERNTGKTKSSKDHIIAQKNDIGMYQQTIKPLFKKGHEIVSINKHRGLNNSAVENSTRYLAINNTFRNSLPLGQTNVSNSGLRHSAISRKSNQNDQSKLKNRSVINNASLLLKDTIAHSRSLKGKSHLHQDPFDKDSMVNATLSPQKSSAWISSKRKPLTTPKATYRTVAAINISRNISSMSGKQTGTSRKNKDSSTKLKIHEDRWVSQPQKSDITNQSVNALLSATSKHTLQRTKQPINQNETTPLALPAETNITRPVSHVKQTSKVTVEFNNIPSKERLQMTKTHNRRHKVEQSKKRIETTQATPVRRLSQVVPTKTTHAAKTALHTAKTTSPTTTIKTTTTTTTTQTPVTTAQTAAATTLYAITATPSALTKIPHGATTTSDAATTELVLPRKTTESVAVSKKLTTASGEKLSKGPKKKANKTRHGVRAKKYPTVIPNNPPESSSSSFPTTNIPTAHHLSNTRSSSALSHLLRTFMRPKITAKPISFNSILDMKETSDASSKANEGRYTNSAMGDEKEMVSETSVNRHKIKEIPEPMLNNLKHLKEFQGKELNQPLVVAKRNETSWKDNGLKSEPRSETVKNKVKSATTYDATKNRLTYEPFHDSKNDATTISITSHVSSGKNRTRYLGNDLKGSVVGTRRTEVIGFENKAASIDNAKSQTSEVASFVSKNQTLITKNNATNSIKSQSKLTGINVSDSHLKSPEVADSKTLENVYASIGEEVDLIPLNGLSTDVANAALRVMENRDESSETRKDASHVEETLQNQTALDKNKRKSKAKMLTIRNQSNTARQVSPIANSQSVLIKSYPTSKSHKTSREFAALIKSFARPLKSSGRKTAKESIQQSNNATAITQSGSMQITQSLSSASFKASAITKGASVPKNVRYPLIYSEITELEQAIPTHVLGSTSATEIFSNTPTSMPTNLTPTISDTRPKITASSPIIEASASTTGLRIYSKEMNSFPRLHHSQANSIREEIKPTNIYLTPSSLPKPRYVHDAIYNIFIENNNRTSSSSNVTNATVLVTNASSLATNSPGLVTNVPGLVTNAPGLATNAPGLVTNASGLVSNASGLATFDGSTLRKVQSSLPRQNGGNNTAILNNYTAKQQLSSSRPEIHNRSNGTYQPQWNFTSAGISRNVGNTSLHLPESMNFTAQMRKSSTNSTKVSIDRPLYQTTSRQRFEDLLKKVSKSSNKRFGNSLKMKSAFKVHNNQAKHETRTNETKGKQVAKVINAASRTIGSNKHVTSSQHTNRYQEKPYWPNYLYPWRNYSHPTNPITSNPNAIANTNANETTNAHAKANTNLFAYKRLFWKGMPGQSPYWLLYRNLAQNASGKIYDTGVKIKQKGSSKSLRKKINVTESSFVYWNNHVSNNFTDKDVNMSNASHKDSEAAKARIGFEYIPQTSNNASFETKPDVSRSGNFNDHKTNVVWNSNGNLNVSEIDASTLSPIDRVKTESKSPVDKEKTENKSPVDKEKTDNKSPVDKVKTENKSPVEKLNTEHNIPGEKGVVTGNKNPVEKVGKESHRPVKEVRTESNILVEKVKTESNIPVDKMKTESNSPDRVKIEPNPLVPSFKWKYEHPSTYEQHLVDKIMPTKSSKTPTETSANSSEIVSHRGTTETHGRDVDRQHFMVNTSLTGHISLFANKSAIGEKLALIEGQIKNVTPKSNEAVYNESVGVHANETIILPGKYYLKEATEMIPNVTSRVTELNNTEVDAYRSASLHRINDYNGSLVNIVPKDHRLHRNNNKTVHKETLPLQLANHFNHSRTKTENGTKRLLPGLRHKVNQTAPTNKTEQFLNVVHRKELHPDMTFRVYYKPGLRRHHKHHNRSRDHSKNHSRNKNESHTAATTWPDTIKVFYNPGRFMHSSRNQQRLHNFQGERETNYTKTNGAVSKKLTEYYGIRKLYINDMSTNNDQSARNPEQSATSFENAPISRNETISLEKASRPSMKPETTLSNKNHPSTAETNFTQNQSAALLDSPKVSLEAPSVTEVASKSPYRVTDDYLTASLVHTTLSPVQKPKLVHSSTGAKKSYGDTNEVSISLKHSFHRKPSDGKHCDLLGIYTDKVLRDGAEAGNYFPILFVKDPVHCHQQCCKNRRCNFAMFYRDFCFLIECFSVEGCDLVKSSASTKHPHLLAKIRNPEVRSLSRVYKTPPEASLTHVPTMFLRPLSAHEISAKKRMSTSEKHSQKLLNLFHSLLSKLENPQPTAKREYVKRKPFSVLATKNSDISAGKGYRPENLHMLQNMSKYLHTNASVLHHFNQSANQTTQSPLFQKPFFGMPLQSPLAKLSNHSNINTEYSYLTDYLNSKAENTSKLATLTPTQSALIRKLYQTSRESNRPTLHVALANTSTTDIQKVVLKLSKFLSNVNLHLKDVLPELKYVMKHSRSKFVSGDIAKTIYNAVKEIRAKELSEKVRKITGETVLENSAENQKGSLHNQELEKLSRMNRTISGKLSQTDKAKRGRNSTKEIKTVKRILTSGLNNRQPKVNADGRLTCIITSVRSGATLYGGPRAGIFTSQGGGLNLDQCIQRCCTSDECHVALLVAGHCYTVKCYTAKLCKVVPMKRAGHYLMTVAYVRRSITISSDKNGKISSTLMRNALPRKAIICQESVVYEGFTLKGGYDAGHFTYKGEVGTLTDCVELCCNAQFCDLVFMVTNQCYLVYCYGREGCQHVKAYHGVLYRTRIAYLHSRNRIIPPWVEPNANELRAIIGSSDTVKSGQLKKDEKFRGTQGKKNNRINIESWVHPTMGTKPPPSVHLYHTENPPPGKQPSNLQICLKAKILYQTTIKGGHRSGKYIYRGKKTRNRDCIQDCCQNEHCNIALMVDQYCFNVLCKNKKRCAVVKVKNKKYFTRLAVIRESMKSTSGEFQALFLLRFR